MSKETKTEEVKDLPTPEAQTLEPQSDLEKRTQTLREGLQKLMEETKVGVQCINQPTATLVDLTPQDNNEAPKQ